MFDTGAEVVVKRGVLIHRQIASKKHYLLRPYFTPSKAMCSETQANAIEWLALAASLLKTAVSWDTQADTFVGGMSE